ncbi:ATP-dependent DNA helicase II subunit 1 [Leucoagaricus sp. SymC.cos]|nr:ATP-dependent DNA helicase II subunit 1 [Leucoagaricus sp. SymC.cos]
MPPYDEWNKIDDEEDEEFLDTSFFEGKRDVILFCIDCSESMLELRDDQNYEDVKTCHLFTALEAAMQIQKRKIIVGPNDSVGIMLFNTTRRSENGRTEASELKRNTFIFQPISLLSAPKVQELIQLLDAARENSSELRETFPPLTGKRMPMGDVFTSCNWVLRDGAPKTATKRVFLITDEDDPHPGSASKQLITSARTTLDDLVQSGVSVEPFFISTDDKPFDVSKFYSQILLPTNLEDDEESADNSSVLPESISISRVEDLLNQMRIHEIPKRALFSIPLQLADGFTIGVKGYGLVTEQKKGSYKYFVDLGDRMEVATSRTAYVDEDQQADVDKTKIVFGVSQGVTTTADDEGDEESDLGIGVKATKVGQRPFYTAEEILSFRALGLEPGIKLLGFKDKEELRFEDNIKHSQFIYPDEMAFSGSKRTFSALLKSMVNKNRIGLALVLTRRNATPIFCALLPQEEHVDENGFADPPGIHVIPLPFADDIRAAPIEEAFRASDGLKDAARAWIDKLSVKNGTYPPDSYPNPALAYHNAQLQASAFREEFDPDSFEDLTEPNIGKIHKRAGSLMKEWKLALFNDDTANVVVAITGTKRKADLSVDEAEIRSKYESNALGKLRVDQLKEFLKAKSQPVSGKKADLIERVTVWLDSH